MYTYDTKRKAAVSSSNSLPIQREIAFSPRTNTYISIPGRVPAFDLAYKKGYARSHTFSHQSIEQIIVNYLNSLEHDTIGLIDSLQIIGGACEEIEYSCRCLGTLISSKAGFMEIVASARKLTSLVSMKSFNLRYGNIKGNQSTGKELDLSFWTDCTLIQEGIYSFVGDLFNAMQLDRLMKKGLTFKIRIKENGGKYSIVSSENSRLPGVTHYAEIFRVEWNDAGRDTETGTALFFARECTP